MNRCAIDLFCGCGGMAEGVIKAGFDIVFSNDISEFASITYNNRHKQLGLIEGVDYSFYKGDIHNLSGDYIYDKVKKLSKYKDVKNIKIDAIFGGPPCQGFSMAGKRDKKDPRNYLFKEYLRIISEISPKYVVMENVVGFLSTRLTEYVGKYGEKYIGKNSLAPNILKNELNKIGYKLLDPQILDASNYGVPQSRKRVIFFAHQEGLKEPSYPLPNFNRVSLEEAIGDIYNPNYSSQYIASRKSKIGNKLHNMEKTKCNAITKERFSLYREGESTTNVKKRIYQTGVNLKSKKHLLRYLSLKLNMSVNDVLVMYKTRGLNDYYLDLLLTKKNIRKKLNRKEPSLTVVTIPDDYINPYNNNIFTVRELARLQSFDDDFIFYGKRTTGGKLRKIETPQYTQVGNAVPPLLAYEVANSIINVLEQK